MIAYIIFSLTYFTKHYTVHVHSCCCKQQSFILLWLSSSPLCVCVCVHTISYLSICWWTLGLLPYLGYCDNVAVNTGVLISFCLLALYVPLQWFSLLSSSLWIHSSVLSSVLLIPYSVFFISVIVHLWLFFIFYNCLLRLSHVLLCSPTALCLRYGTSLWSLPGD